MKQFLFFLLVLCLATSCKDDYDAVEQHSQDVAAIEAYLTSNNIAFEKTDGDVYYYLTQEGNNNGNPSINNTVVCDYVGFFFDELAEDGTLAFFDGTTSEPATFQLTGVIEGWQEGIPRMSRNASGRFFIPSTMAYGNRGSRDIGKNEILVFDITLIHFY